MIPLPMIDSCPKFSHCSAPVCPLDRTLAGAVHLPGEPVCGFLLATGKQGAEEMYAGSPVFAAAKVQLPDIIARWPDIGRRVEKAAQTGFKVSNLKPKPAAVPRGAHGQNEAA